MSIQFKATVLIIATAASLQMTSAHATQTATSACQVAPCPTQVPQSPLPLAQSADVADVEVEDAEETIRWPRWRNGCKRGGFGKVTCPKWN